MRICAHRLCNQPVTATHHGALYCSTQCRSREKYQVVADRRGATVKTRRPVDPEGRCAIADCRQPIPPERQANARFCSRACSLRSKNPHALALVPAGANAPRKTRPRKPTLREALIAPCEGCRHLAIQTAAWRGVECARGAFTACNPLGPQGPRLKEAM